jgi:hypothetical protein
MHRFNLVTGIALAALMTVAGAAHAATRGAEGMSSAA